MKKYKVSFLAGEVVGRERSGDQYGCNYMIVNDATDADGDRVELYAEVRWADFLWEVHSMSDAEIQEIADTDSWGEYESEFDEWSYPQLKEEILEQAKEAGIPAESLEFYWD